MALPGSNSSNRQSARVEKKPPDSIWVEFSGRRYSGEGTQVQNQFAKTRESVGTDSRADFLDWLIMAKSCSYLRSSGIVLEIVVSEVRFSATPHTPSTPIQPAHYAPNQQKVKLALTCISLVLPPIPQLLSSRSTR
jgi:hypothetical protein